MRNTACQVAASALVSTHAPVSEPHTLVLAAQQYELVAQDDDLYVFGVAGPYGEAGQHRGEHKVRYTPLRIGGYLP